MTAATHDERHALLEELDLLRTRRRELADDLVSDDDPPRDFGDQGTTIGLRDEIDRIDRRVRDLVHVRRTPCSSPGSPTRTHRS